MDYNLTLRQKDKNWQVIVSYKDDNGKWKQKSKQGFEKKAEAKRYGDKIVEELQKTVKLQTPKELQDITLEEFKDLYLQERNTALAYNTLRNFKLAYRQFAHLGSMPITEIKYVHIAPVVNKMLELYAYNTVITYVRQISRLFRHAVKPYRLIIISPFADIEIKKPRTTQKIKALTKEEASTFLTALEKRHYMYYLMATIAAKTGGRISEILALTWQDIDFATQTLWYNKQWGKLKAGGFGNTPPKTANSNRTVPIPNSLRSILQKHKAEYPAPISGRIFCFKSRNASSKFGQLCDSMGFPDITMHVMRHTYATTLLSEGVNVKTVAALLGDTVKTVIQTYIHYTEDMRQEAFSKVNSIL